MAETEIIRLKKEIHHLREQNADLQAELEEKNEKLGKIETEYLKMKNETMMLTKSKLMQHQELIRVNVEKVLESERERMNFMEKNLEEALQKISYMEQEKINFENREKELQVQNYQLKKQLQDWGQKNQMADFLKDIKDKEDYLNKKDHEYQKLVMEWNQLCDKMEDILSENRLLKELANVPENFGINIQEIKMGDRMKIEDYKAKIRILQREVDDLETERAQLKHKLIFLANALEIKEPPFSMLNTEQKRVVAEYAQALYEGREFIVPERYQLMKDKEELKNKIEFLEKQIQNRVWNSEQINSNYLIKDKNNNNSNENLAPLIEMLKKENEDLKSLLNKTLDKIGNLEGLNFANNASSSNFQNQNLNNTGITPVELNYLQLPPVPLLDNNNVDNTGYAYSYRFNTKIKIDPNQIHTLFGIAKDDSDIDALKVESASLQTQLIELLEVVSRLKNQDVFLNENLDKLYNKLENIVLMQNELMEKYTSEKKEMFKNVSENSQQNKLLNEQLQDIKRKNKALEDTISLLESRNLSQIEQRAVDKMKENSILEVNYIKLLRKFEALQDEEAKMRKLAEDIEKNSIEKDTQLEAVIVRLKEWKMIMGSYLKFLIKKLKRSVDKEEFDKILLENKYFREKYNEMVVRDVNVTKQVSVLENLKMKFKETEQNFYDSEEMRIDCEIEINMLKKRLQECDPHFYIQEKTFREFLRRLNEAKMSFAEIRKVFDNDNSGSISRKEFIAALKSLNIYTSNGDKPDGTNTSNTLPSEVDILIMSLNPDEDDKIDTFYFIRKLERAGVIDSDWEINGDKSSLYSTSNSNDEKILQQFIEGVKNSGMSLKSVFELFDSSGDGIISREEFKFALQQLKININDELLNRIILLINGTGNHNIDTEESSKSNTQMDINYYQFCELFDQKSRYLNLKNKKDIQFKQNLKIDWKTNLISTIVDGIKKNNLTFIQAFEYLDKDKSGVISKEEFTTFLRRINVNFKDTEIEALFKMLDKNADNSIESGEFVSVLRDCEQKIQVFKSLTGLESENNLNNTNNNANMESMQPHKHYLNTNNSNSIPSETNLKNKYALLSEKEKYYNYKIQQMRNRLQEMEKMNKETTTQLEEYVKKHSEMMEKYFTTSEELQKLKTIFDSSGVKREDLNKIEMTNDNLTREVTVLRVGLNTFKDLYKSSNRQIQMLTLKANRNEDEIDTYKKAIKDLQSESNSNALIGKLYYSLLISRWREAATLRKYDDFITEFSNLREENFRFETENKQLQKEVVELQNLLQDKVIENLRLEDQLESISQGFNTGEGRNGSSNHLLEDLKLLLRQMQTEKTEISDKYFQIRRENLRLQTELEEVRGKVEYSEALASRIKYNNADEFSKKLISASEEISKLKLTEAVMKRENHFLKETETHLNKLVKHLNENVRDLEVVNSEWEGKYRKMEETWRKRDEERQKKFFEGLKNLNAGTFLQLRGDNNSNNTGNKGSSNSIAKISEYENKIKELSDIISLKNNEISQLMNINKENEELLREVKESNPNLAPINSYSNPLLSKNNLDILKDDETQLVAQTAHKTIKTLQDLLNTKSQQLSKKDEVIENLKEDAIKTKAHYLNTISKLQEQIQLDHDSTIKKLKHTIDSVNQNLLIKVSKSQLSTMTLADIEALLEEKDNAIKSLAVELKHTQEENEINYLKINDLNKQINDLNLNINEKKFMSGIESHNEEVQRLKRIIKEKTEMIEEEKVRIKKISEEFNKRLQDRTLLEDQIFKSSVHIPERLVDNSEKSQLYTKIQSLRNKNKKLTVEVERLKGIIEESKKKEEENAKQMEKLRNENKLFLQTQVKDTKTISRLKKEKEDLANERDKLKEKVENLTNTNTNTNSNGNIVRQPNTENIINVNNKPKRGLSAQRKKPAEKDIEKEKEVISINNSITTAPININKQDDKVEKAEKEIKSNSNNSNIPTTVNSPEEVLKRLVYYSLKKNINMNRHLQRYDITKMGKITKTDFTKAIDELKLGFVESDISKLFEISKITGDYVEISHFVKLMVEKDANYENLIKEYELLQDPHMKRQPTKKYNPFENKSFNINY